ncbi:unnamed protein product [Rotaria socialis]|uniref:Carboxylic ester hydrolase n=3 Tax=Rotaria socialis TaxID=392032 RepID=A0A820N3D1_9BILA|nr:unnamed protein product [Rotaria socialis]CAF4384325.1 unnamed protein product [Rotaria socialis]
MFHWPSTENMILSLLILACLYQHVDTNQSIIVSTKYGDVLGYETPMARVFYGIPFAQPPVGALRWNPPVAISKWTGKVINATKPPPACPQRSCDIHSLLCPTNISEDCLYLNIFTPLLNTSSSSSLLPVMIFITGGTFQFLGASLPIYEAERFVNTSNVICVFIQYRLGVLGFLATGTGPNDLHGNYGILDQRLSIAWVNENVDVFGGDPNQITLFGQSAGGQSTALHYVSSEMQSFFQAAIIQSSPMLLPFRTYAEYITPAVFLAEKLNCTIGNITCFRETSYQDIIVAQSQVNGMITSLNILISLEPWVPVIDNSVVHDQLMNTILNISFALKPLIIGTLTDEALSFVHGAFHKPVLPLNYTEISLVLFRDNFLKVIERYPPDGLGDQRPLLTRITTQWIFACPARIFARKTATYSYVFGFPLEANGTDNSSVCQGCACHGDEIPFLFESLWNNFTDAGKRISESLATYWTNYAKTKDPNQPVQIPLVWPRLMNNVMKYLYFQDPVQIIENYLKDDCDFWDTIGYQHNYF